MIKTSKVSRKEIFKAVICFALVTGFYLNGFASDLNKDTGARKKLVEKYRDHKLLRDRLEAILFPTLDVWKKPIDMEEANKYFGAPYDIANEKSPRATEALVDLLDFYVGEHTSAVTIPELIAARGKEAIPFLKRKISQKSLSSEREIRRRNEIIVELIKIISCGAKIIDGESDFSKEDIMRSLVFYAQMDLEKYYCKKGHYPKKLSEAYPVGEFFGKEVEKKLYYKSYGLLYFLCALGEDGKFGTADDVKPPYNADVFSFPDGFKE